MEKISGQKKEKIFLKESKGVVVAIPLFERNIQVKINKNDREVEHESKNDLVGIEFRVLW